MSPQFCYSFAHPHTEAPRDLADLLGGKGANLAEMTTVLAIPVPPGFTISTQACKAYLAQGWPPGLDAEISFQIDELESRIGRKLGDDQDPLLVSVRSGARSSMPGMLDTVLNLGLTPITVEALARQTDDRFAYDSFRRFILMYAKIVMEADMLPLDSLVGQALAANNQPDSGNLPDREQARLCSDLLDVLNMQGTPLPADPRAQLRLAVEAVFRSWNGKRAQTYRARENISNSLGTAVNIQAMVFGNRDDRSGTGVAFTRDASTGLARPYGDFLLKAQGEDVVAGIRKTSTLDAMRDLMPGLHTQLMDILARLEAHYRDMCDTEFTVESGKLWMLQTRIGKRTARAALRMAVDMARQDGWHITKAEALARFNPAWLDQLQFPSLARGRATPIAQGLPASPGVAIGRAYFSADACLDAVARDETVVLVRTETSPEDVHGMQVAEGILTSRGGLVSHAAVVARGWNIPAVVGAEKVVIAGDGFTAGPYAVKEGDEISFDGATGEVYLGRMDLVAGGIPEELSVLLDWAREIDRDPEPSTASPKQLLARARARGI